MASYHQMQMPHIGESINNHMSQSFREFCYTTVDQVVDMLIPGIYLASVDIASAYRSILVNKDQWKYQGLAWELEGKCTIPIYVSGCGVPLTFLLKLVISYQGASCAGVTPGVWSTWTISWYQVKQSRNARKLQQPSQKYSVHWGFTLPGKNACPLVKMQNIQG